MVSHAWTIRQGHNFSKVLKKNNKKRQQLQLLPFHEDSTPQHIHRTVANVQIPVDKQNLSSA